MADHAPSVAMEAVLKPSSALPEDMPKIRGYDFNQGVDHRALLQSYITTGFQASSMGQAIQEINKMVGRGPGCSYLRFYVIILGYRCHINNVDVSC